MDPNGIMLVGAAAESWVKLQWISFFSGIGFVAIFLIILGILVYKVYMV